MSEYLHTQSQFPIILLVILYVLYNHLQWTEEMYIMSYRYCLPKSGLLHRTTDPLVSELLLHRLPLSCKEASLCYRTTTNVHNMPFRLGTGVATGIIPMPQFPTRVTTSLKYFRISKKKTWEKMRRENNVKSPNFQQYTSHLLTSQFIQYQTSKSFGSAGIFIDQSLNH